MKNLFVVLFFLFIFNVEAKYLEKTTGNTPEYKKIHEIYEKNIRNYAKTKKIPKNVIPEKDLNKMYSGEVFEVNYDASKLKDNEETKRFLEIVK